MIERTTLTVTSTSATGFGAEQHEKTRIIPREVWVASEPLTVEVRKYAKLGHLIGPRLVATYLPGLRQVSFDVVTDYDTTGIRISVKMARRLARFILEHTEDEKRPSDGLSDLDTSPREGKPGKREEDPKEEPTEVNEEEA